jgi:calcineurin-like phosphoesterase
VNKFLTNMPSRFEPAAEDVRLCGALVECDPATGRASSIERIMLKQE